MNKEIIRKTGELYLSSKDRELLEYLCTTIGEKILARKPIYEKMIMDFSLLIARLIHGGMLFDLPQSYEKLTDIVERYWFYSSRQENDPDLSFSYVRIYQNISLLKTYSENSKRESTIRDDANQIRKLSKQVQAIQAIHDNPGSTHGDISEIIGTSKSNLSQRIAGLIEREYIVVSRVGKYNYYSLSNKGLELYGILCIQDQENEEMVHWSRSHVKVLSFLMQVAADTNDSPSIIDTTTISRLVDQLSKYDEEKIEDVLTVIGKGIKKKDENLGFVGLESIWDYQQKRTSVNNVLASLLREKQINERLDNYKYLKKADTAAHAELVWSRDLSLTTKEMEVVK